MIISIVPDSGGAERNGNAPENSSHAPDEWLTIAEAARRLGIHPRQARRYADRLMDNERTPEGQRPQRVQWAAISSMYNNGHDNGQPMDNGRPESSPDVKSEVAFLRAQLAEKDRQLERRDQSESELRRLMLADKAELVELRQRLALPPAPEQTSTTPEQTSNRPWWRWWQRS